MNHLIHLKNIPSKDLKKPDKSADNLARITRQEISENRNGRRQPAGHAPLPYLATNKAAGHIGFCLHHPGGA